MIYVQLAVVCVVVTLLTLIVTSAVVFLGALAGLEYARSVFRGGDYTLAALFGGDGRHSVSAYCGRAMVQGGPRVLVFAGKAIDLVFGKGHCAGAAQREGLIPAGVSDGSA